jgi:hypothetical protein
VSCHLRFVLTVVATVSCASAALAQVQPTTRVSFELFADEQLIPPGTDVHADDHPVVTHWRIDAAGDPLLAIARIDDIGGSQEKVLDLSGGARFWFQRQIGVWQGRFDVDPSIAGGSVELDSHAYALAPLLATTNGTLETGDSRWNYTVSPTGSGFLSLTTVRNSGFPAFGTPQFGVVGNAGLVVDNVRVLAFPEPSSAALTAMAAAVLPLVRRRRAA